MIWIFFLDYKVYKEFRIHFGMMLCIIIISTGAILMRRTFVVWRCHPLLMLAKNYMLAWNLIVNTQSRMRSNNMLWGCIKVSKWLKANGTSMSFVAWIKMQIVCALSIWGQFYLKKSILRKSLNGVDHTHVSIWPWPKMTRSLIQI